MNIGVQVTVYIPASIILSKYLGMDPIALLFNLLMNWHTISPVAVPLDIPTSNAFLHIFTHTCTC